MIRTILRYDSVDRLPLGDLAVRLAPVAEAIQSEVIAGGALGIADLPDGIKGTFRFDARDPRAMAWAQARGGALIRDLSDGARMQARSVIAQSVENGWTTAETADELQRTIGLHDRWARAVSNAWPREYDRLLSSGLSEAEAKRRATEFTDRYRQRLIRARAENIARTEVMQASNQGRWLSWAQGVEGGYVTSTAKKKWLTGPLVTRTPSRKQVCDVCRGLRDEVVPWDKPFSNGQMMPPAHPSCRCTAALVPPSEEEIDALLQADDERASVPARQAKPIPDGYVEAQNAVTTRSLNAMKLDKIGKAFGGETGSLIREIDYIMKLPKPRTIEEARDIRNALRDASSRLRDRMASRDSTRGGKLVLNDLWEAQGYRGKMTLVDRDTFVLGEKASKYKTQYRGVNDVPGKTAREIQDELLRGELWQGDGVYGQGTYAARAVDTDGFQPSEFIMHTKRAEEANSYGRQIVRTRLRDDAKVIPHKNIDTIRYKLGPKYGERLNKILDEWREDMAGLLPMTDMLDVLDEIRSAHLTIRKLVVESDQSIIASLLGYDAIEVTNSLQGYTVVLNRTALISDSLQGRIDIIFRDLLQQVYDGDLEVLGGLDSVQGWRAIVQTASDADLLPAGVRLSEPGDTRDLLRRILGK